MAEIDRYTARWAERASLTALLQSAGDPSDIRHEAAATELVDRFAHIAVDALLRERGSNYAESSPVSRIGSSGGSSSGCYASMTERKADHLEDQDTGTRLALLLLSQLKPRHRVALLIDTYRKRLRMSRQGAVDNWQQLAGALHLTVHFEPDQFRSMTARGLEQAGRKCLCLMRELLERLLAASNRSQQADCESDTGLNVKLFYRVSI